MDLSFPKPNFQSKKLATTSLQEYCVKNKLQRPVVELYFYGGIFVCRITVIELNVSGHGSGERRTGAQEQAAGCLLQKLQARVFEGVNKTPRVDGGLVQMLYELCQIADFSLPDYEAYTTDEDERVFVAMCKVGTNICYGTGESQSDAKHIAAKDMMDCILQEQKLASDHQEVEEDQKLMQKFKTARMKHCIDDEFYKARQKFHKGEQ